MSRADEVTKIDTGLDLIREGLIGHNIGDQEADACMQNIIAAIQTAIVGRLINYICQSDTTEFILEAIKQCSEMLEASFWDDYPGIHTALHKEFTLACKVHSNDEGLWKRKPREN